MSSVEFLPANPKRPVDWRWRRATQLAENPHLSFNRRYDDIWILRARDFLRDFNRSEDEIDRFQLAESQSGIFYAYDLYREDSSLRYELEARLLSQQSHPGIAHRCCLEYETVTIYERLFFNVEERIRNTGYILHCVIGEALHRGLSEREYDLLWKWYGYMYGPHMLDALIGQVGVPQRVTGPGDVDSAMRADGLSSMVRKQALAARLMPINPFTQVELLHVYAKFVEIERTAGTSAAEQKTTILQNIEQTLVHLPWAIGRDANVDAHRAIDYYRGGAELRTDELLLTAAGDAPAGLDQIEALGFPRKRDETNEQGR